MKHMFTKRGVCRTRCGLKVGSLRNDSKNKDKLTFTQMTKLIFANEKRPADIYLPRTQ